MNLSNNADYYTNFPKEWDSYYYPTFIPEDFTFETAKGTSISKRITFVNQVEQVIVFFQAKNGTDFQLDTENAKTIEVDVNGCSGMLIEKEGQCMLFWHNNDHSFLIKAKIDKRVILKMAVSVEKNK